VPSSLGHASVCTFLGRDRALFTQTGAQGVDPHEQTKENAASPKCLPTQRIADENGPGSDQLIVSQVGDPHAHYAPVLRVIDSSGIALAVGDESAQRGRKHLGFGVYERKAAR